MCALCTLNAIPLDKQIYIYFKTVIAQWWLLKFEAWGPKSEITVQNGHYKNSWNLAQILLLLEKSQFIYNL